MDRLAFTAAAAITENTLARQHMVHELANMSTVGFKRSFDMAMQSITAQGAGFASRVQPQTLAKDQIRLEGGTVMTTGRALDVAMNRSTVLGVTAADGTLAFTRRGDLRVNPNGVLETGSGHMVQSQDGGPITIPVGSRINITKTGEIYASDPTQPGVPQEQLIANLMLHDASTTHLIKREDGLFRVDEKPLGTDFATGPEPVSLTPQALEGSSVNPMASMVKLIEQSRSFEHQVRIIKESKSNDESGASMMKAS